LQRAKRPNAEKLKKRGRRSRKTAKTRKTDSTIKKNIYRYFLNFAPKKLETPFAFRYTEINAPDGRKQTRSARR